MQDEIAFYGHPNIQSFHPRTIEITKESHLSLKGDCIIGVRATKACADLDSSMKSRLGQNESHVKIEIIVGNDVFMVSGMGSEGLTLKSSHDMVIRKTNFVCPRTVSVKCDKASSDIPRGMIEALKSQEAVGLFRITVE